MISQKTKTVKEKVTLPVAVAITSGIFMILGESVFLMNNWPQPMSGLPDKDMNNIFFASTCIPQTGSFAID